MATKKWTPAEKQELKELYLANVPLKDLMVRFSTNAYSIYNQCRELKIKRKFKADPNTDTFRRRPEKSPADWPSDWPRADEVLMTAFSAMIRSPR